MIDTFTVCSAPSSLRERRDALGVTRQQMAERARCSMGSVAVLETDDAPSRSKVLTRILAVLDELETERARNDEEPAGRRAPVPTSTTADCPGADVLTA